MVSRRNFLKKAAVSAAGIGLVSASGYANILGSNSKINIGLIGLGGRSKALVKAIKLSGNCQIAVMCDVDEERIEFYKGYCKKNIGYVPKVETDFRRILEDKDIDAIAVVTPEHWHAPMAIMGMQAGKHVYVEKPCSHNLFENELVVAAQKKYNKVCQMGNQQRSSKSSAQAVSDIREGVIGNVYAGKAWYNNKRGSIGKGKVVTVPSTLNWDLWQGPAPREEYRHNVHPYNWHWFRTWGTGEIHNNGTHEIDICRWALGVDYPERVVSAGGRLHYTNDDWEFFDTQMASFDFKGGKTISWEGHSCNKFGFAGGRGCTIHGTKGTIFLDRSKYELYGANGEKVKTVLEKETGTSNNTADKSGFDRLTVTHMTNFANAIIKNEKLNSPIHDAAITTHLCHLGNIAQDTGEALRIDTNTGKILDKVINDKYYKREYEKGWEPKL
ncbi:Gfo/Idh/MocA family oxidoreductase [Labilibacter sediminis]|nr:Gfo/Idh/MocA family oxidoreductase [Labilibacter sediminis]